MNKITWNDSYSVNNAALDAQHQELIEIHNHLDHLLLTGGGHEMSAALSEAIQIIHELLHYHFQQEEEHMRQINFPNIVEHKRLHSDFEDCFFQYYRQMINGELVLTSEIISVIKNWHIDHILHEDMKYVSFQQKK